MSSRASAWEAGALKSELTIGTKLSTVESPAILRVKFKTNSDVDGLTEWLSTEAASSIHVLQVQHWACWQQSVKRVSQGIKHSNVWRRVSADVRFFYAFSDSTPRWKPYRYQHPELFFWIASSPHGCENVCKLCIIWGIPETIEESGQVLQLCAWAQSQEACDGAATAALVDQTRVSFQPSARLLWGQKRTWVDRNGHAYCRACTIL